METSVDVRSCNGHTRQRLDHFVWKTSTLAFSTHATTYSIDGGTSMNFIQESVLILYYFVLMALGGWRCIAEKCRKVRVYG